ncbi:glycosyltransferase family 4 protein [Inquilinus sp. OTU3971]|uniref:glycosyltransferase family 4 protein n=1 Tax=Inquilinus sp. OTU3971 TaxID=3043855 RepID=UPI00313E581F
MRFAYFGFPHIGGTYSVFRHLHAGLAPHGIDLRWLGYGPAAHRAANGAYFRSQQDLGLVAGRPDDDDRAGTEAMIEAIEREGFDGVFVNVAADRVQTNCIRYLPSRILRVMIVHNITPGTYAAALAIRDHVHATVGVSDRIRADLVSRHGFDDGRTMVIPNGIEAADVARSPRGGGEEALRLLFLGRIDDQAKGVLWLPRILQEIPDPVTLTVTGDGPDFARFKRSCDGTAGFVRCLGAVAPTSVGALLAEHDVLIMPSRFEGFPVTLVEAMAAGCVPVASLLRGVTDMAVQDGRNGRLFPVGDVKAAAQAVIGLARDRAALARMSGQASATARELFGVGLMADRYRALLDRVAEARPAIAAPIDLARWRFPPGLRDGLRTYLPTPVKNGLRMLRERYA